jgi:two-component system, chemotaxis family, CheB/CheR fusion protein
MPTKKVRAAKSIRRGDGKLAIAGIAASAGGLDAFKRFFSAMPPHSGVACVVVPHLSPGHESLMAEILAKQTSMPVVEARHGMPIEPDHVYVIPPNKYLSTRDGRLRLSGPVSLREAQTPIDFFLHSLAEELRERAVGVVLSGTGSHGTAGLKAVKASGGMTMVQDPTTAEYGQMPQSAMDAGVADFVLAPERMPDALARWVRHAYVRGNDGAFSGDTSSKPFGDVISLLRSKTRLDFGCYRKNLIRRRIERRMSLHHIEKLADYVAFLRKRPEESAKLTKDLLISVTSFFRDPEAFRVLERSVIPEILKHRRQEAPIRVWVPGCATGEEAYSIAMLFLERMADAGGNPQISVFASDVDENALEVGRRGVYPHSLTANVSPKRRARFFVRDGDDGYAVNRELRDSVVFAAQNLVGDAPFSKLDLVSCRNLLIYLEPEVQKKVVSLFHFSLNEGGYLFLGPAETVGRHVDLFEPVSKRWRIYRRLASNRRAPIEFPIVPGTSQRIDVRRPVDIAVARTLASPEQVTRQILLQDLAPAAVLVDRRFEILYFHGPTMRYLDQPSGEPTRNLLAMSPDGLRAKIRSATRKAARDRCRVVASAVRIGRSGHHRRVRITARPVRAPKIGDGLLLVTFEDETEPTSSGSRAAGVEGSLVHELQDELRSTRDDLQQTVAELETSNQDLAGSNEEILSMNEELQSANEELETSKEELQSLNEELSTVNGQLQDKVDELEKANDDMSNLLTSSDIATVFLDTKLRIRRFTAAATKLMRLIATDVDRPFADISRRFDDDRLFHDLRRVLRRGEASEIEVRSDDGRWYLRRALPYRSRSEAVAGVVVTFTDVTATRLADDRLRRLATVLMDSNDAVTVEDLDGRITAWNHGAERMYGYTHSEALKLCSSRLVPPHLRASAKARMVRLRSGEVVSPWDTQRLHKNGRVFDVSITATALKDPAGRPIAIATTERDVTERRALEREVAESAAKEQRRVGRELHDVTGQELTGLSLLARSLAESLEEHAAPGAETARKITEGLRRALRQVRALARGLNPVAVDSEGLAAALEDLAARTTEVSGIVCTFDCAKQVSIASTETATHVFRIAQEAITNAVKHAGATRIAIRLVGVRSPKSVRLEVVDDGGGIRKGRAAGTGAGLRIMGYRAGMIGAKLEVVAAPSGGTIVSCTLPEIE